VRRWAVEWLSAGNASVCPEILAPGYSILIGGHRLEGREAYVEGTLAQLSRFPGLGLTIHELICAQDRVAVRFTEHGAAARLGGREAAWGGIALFRWDGTHLSECRAEEDYLARRRQLDVGTCDPIEPPAPAPWSRQPADPDPAAEKVVAQWLEQGDLSVATLDDSWLGQEVSLHLTETSIELTELFSAGDGVAFHARQSGHYAGGLKDVAASPGAPAEHHLVGLVSVRDGTVAAGRVVRDRLGLARALTPG